MRSCQFKLSGAVNMESSDSDYRWDSVEGTNCIKTLFDNARVEKVTNKEAKGRKAVKDNHGMIHKVTIIFDSMAAGVLCNAIIYATDSKLWIY